MGIAISWIAISIILGSIGTKKECGFFKPFICSLLLSPIIGGIYLICSRQRSTISEGLERAKILYENGIISEYAYQEAKKDIASGKNFYEKRYIRLSEEQTPENIDKNSKLESPNPSESFKYMGVILIVIFLIAILANILS